MLFGQLPLLSFTSDGSYSLRKQKKLGDCQRHSHLRGQLSLGSKTNSSSGDIKNAALRIKTKLWIQIQHWRHMVAICASHGDCPHLIVKRLTTKEQWVPRERSLSEEIMKEGGWHQHCSSAFCIPSTIIFGILGVSIWSTRIEAA